MSFFDQFSKVTKDFGSKVQETTKDIMGKVEDQQAISRLNTQINDANNLIKNTYMAIGETYYKLHMDDVECEFSDQFQIISKALKTIDDCREKISVIKGELICPSCGAVVSRDASFCPSCGSKIEHPQPEEKETEEVIYCSCCGDPIQPGDLFCTNCGTPVAQPDEEPASKSDEPSEEEDK